VTNLTAKSRALVRFYNKRGTAEQWIKESKQAVAMTRLSRHRFAPTRCCPRRSGRSLNSLQQRLVKPGGRLIKHARYY